MSDKAWKKGTQRLEYYFNKWKKNGAFDIINDISEYITLVWMKDSRGNVNHAVSVVGDGIIDYNIEKGLTLKKASLDLICSCTDEKYSIAEFEEVFYTVRFINPKAENK